MTDEMRTRLKEKCGEGELPLKEFEIYGYNYLRINKEGVFHTFRSNPETLMVWGMVPYPVLVKIFEQFFGKA